jgi:hypothetical protein
MQSGILNFNAKKYCDDLTPKSHNSGVIARRPLPDNKRLSNHVSAATNIDRLVSVTTNSSECIIA